MEASGSLAPAAAECGQMMRVGQKPVPDKLRLVSEFERLRHSEIREAAAPLSELGRLRMADAVPASKALDKTAWQWAEPEHQFRSLKLGEAQLALHAADRDLAGQFGRAEPHNGSDAHALDRYGKRAGLGDCLRRTLGDDAGDDGDSAFRRHARKALRRELGKLALDHVVPDHILPDPLARREFYLARA